MVTILTLANKPALLLEALASVAAQTRTDYRHIVHLDGGAWPARTYPPAVFWNQHALSAGPEDYVTWLSDDDRWEPHYLETLAGFLDAHPEVGACYGGSKHVTYDPATGETVWQRDLPAAATYDAGWRPSCRIDGGQVLVRRAVLARIPPPMCPEEITDCNIADGTLLNRIAEFTSIVPVVGSWVMQNRTTPSSSHWRLVGGRLHMATGETQARLARGREA